MSEIENTRMLSAALAPALLAQEAPVTRAVHRELHTLSLLQSLTLAVPEAAVGLQLSAAPEKVEAPVPGSDGTVYYLPQARVAMRSKASPIPHVFLEKKSGDVVLQVYFDLGPAAGIPADAKPLPIENVSVALVGADGTRIDFPRCDVLPPADGTTGVVSRLYCEAVVEVNAAVATLKAPQSIFRVEADVAYALFEAPGGFVGPIVTDIAVAPLVDLPVDRAYRRRDRARMATPLMRDASVLGDALRIRPDFVIADPVVAGPGAIPPGTNGAVVWTPYRRRLSLGGDGDINAHFDTSIPENRPIYARVTSGFGAEPWSDWIESSNGRFMDAPVPEHFYILPDEYRLVIDGETKAPSLLVLLVPPKAGADPAAPASFGSSYTLRTRFGIVPWVDPARRERLRGEIAVHSGIPYPQLVVGGMAAGTCALSKVLHELGSTLVGTEGTVAVDPKGFELVLDCTSEFYSTLSHLLVTDGVDATATVSLVSMAAEAPRVDIPVSLRLDLPASDVLLTEFLPGVPIEPATPTPAAPEGEMSTEVEPDTAPVVLGPPTLRVRNPLPYPVTVTGVRATLLVVDDTLPTPIGAVPASADPGSFTLPASTAEPSSIDLLLTPAATDLPPVFGAIGVDFLGVSIEVDPDQVLAKAHDTGASGSVTSAVELKSYQLQHPDTLPPTLADVYGLEVQLRRAEGAATITSFLTKDQPAVDVQVAFTLADIVAGAKPEQPTFEWRRRNMAGAGNGEWSAWESITGRQLFVSPIGM